MARERQVNFRVSQEEMERFAKVASHYGLTITSIIRMLFKRESKALGLETKKRKEKNI